MRGKLTNREKYFKDLVSLKNLYLEQTGYFGRLDLRHKAKRIVKRNSNFLT